MAVFCQVREDGSVAAQWELGGQPLVVGRGDAAEARVEDEAASRRHAVILNEGNDYIIEDLGSQNGTWVDGRRVLAARLHHNVRILIGRTQFVFLERPLSAVTAAQASPRSTGRENPVVPARLLVSANGDGGPGLSNQP